MKYELLEMFFWLISFLIGYIYLGYPLILSCTSKLNKSINGHSEIENLPSVTLFIPVYNEASIIKKKIKNSLSLTYPSELLEIAIASDGSTDKTNKIILEYQKKGVIIFNNKKNNGKNSVINKFVPLTKGEILIFTDANSMFTPDSLRNLVKPFSDPKVGCVGGKLKYMMGKSLTSMGENFYFKYENMIRRLEGSHGKMVGANGAIYALRRNLFTEVPEHVPNDFFHPLSVLKRNLISVFVANAVAREKPTEKRKEEFNRRVRIVARSVGALVEVNRLYGIFSGRAWFNIISHKVLRWFAFSFLIALFVCNLFLLNRPIFLCIFASQVLFYTMGFIGYMLDSKGIKVKIFHIPYYFMLINIAGTVGIYKYLRGQKNTKWEPASTTR